MPTQAFLVQIPEEIRKNHELNKFFELIIEKMNFVIRQSNNSENSIIDLAIKQEEIDGGGSGSEEEDLQEILLANSPISPIVAISGQYYFTGGNNYLYRIILPRFPEENFFIRAQTFGLDSIRLETPSGITINNTNQVLLSGDGTTADVKYSLQANRYIVT